MWLALPCAAYAQVQELTQAIVRASPHAGPAHQAMPVDLPYKWDAQHPGSSGEAVFEIAFALSPEPQPSSSSSPAFAGQSLLPYALFVARVGTVYEVWLNGSLLSAQGNMQGNVHGRAQSNMRTEPQPSDYAKAPRLLPIPAQLLQANNLLRIVLHADAGRGGGLSAVVVGPQGEVAAHYLSAQRWRVWGVLAVLVFSVCVGLLSALLWLTQPPPDLLARSKRDHLTLWAALGEGAWALVLADLLLESPWLAWPQWAVLVQLALLVAVAMAVVFLCSIAVSPLRACWKASSAAEPAGATGQSAWHWACPVLAMLACASAALWQAWHSSQWSAHWPSTPWWAYASTLFGVAVAAITLARFRADTAQVQDLMATLAQRVTDKEQALQRNYAQLEATARAQESSAERARVLRDMNDSVGSHIGLALRQISAKHSAPEVLHTLRSCLDQLKLSIDALQLPAGDVAALLANLRYRLSPRLASAGIALQWQVDLLPVLARHGPDAMRQLQQLLFEAITAAVAQSAGASLRVQASASSQVLCIGLVCSEPAFAHDIPSAWQLRASAVGARLTSASTGLNTNAAASVARTASTSAATTAQNGATWPAKLPSFGLTIHIACQDFHADSPTAPSTQA